MAKKKKAASNTLEIQNAVKTMLANIRFASVDNPMQSIVLTSAVPNEGKTTTTIELAKAIASAGNSVLLVEADMRRRSAASVLGVHAAHGAYAVMSHALSLREAVVSTGTPNFYFLDTEPNIPNPADLLSSRAYAKLLDDACNAYDYVLFDTPPVGAFVDAAILSRLVDGVILVVKIGGAKRDEILTAYDQLQKAEANVIGACATFCEGTGSEYYYAYYNKDNQRVDPEKEARRARKRVVLLERAPFLFPQPLLFLVAPDVKDKPDSINLVRQISSAQRKRRKLTELSVQRNRLVPSKRKDRVSPA